MPCLRGVQPLLNAAGENCPLATLLSFASRPLTVVFGLGTRLRMCMRTKLENGILGNRQQHFDQGEFEAMKTLGG